MKRILFSLTNDFARMLASDKDASAQEDDNGIHNTTGTSSNSTIDEDFDAPEEEHAEDADIGTMVNLTLIACFLLAYCIKQYRLYYLPESAAAMILGIIMGGITRFASVDQFLLEFVSLGSLVCMLSGSLQIGCTFVNSHALTFVFPTAYYTYHNFYLCCPSTNLANISRETQNKSHQKFSSSSYYLPLYLVSPSSLNLKSL